MCQQAAWLQLGRSCCRGLLHAGGVDLRRMRLAGSLLPFASPPSCTAWFSMVLGSPCPSALRGSDGMTPPVFLLAGWDERPWRAAVAGAAGAGAAGGSLVSLTCVFGSCPSVACVAGGRPNAGFA